VAVSNLIRLLDLPDEALALIESGELTEGHGRALLLAEGHTVRRTLAREASSGEWSVRELEARARAAASDDGTAKRATRARRRRALHPDQEAAITQISDALGEALGCEVDVTPSRRGYRAELSFESLDDALDLARRLRVRAAA
jgi:ParB family chromosome partitioning protein